MNASDKELVDALAAALRGLVEYVDARTDEYTDDDDVRALEEVAGILQRTPLQAQKQLRNLWGDELAEEVGLES